MNTINKLLITTAISTAFLSNVNAATQFAKKDTSNATELCAVAASGSKIKMYKAMQDVDLSKNYVVRNIRCNGQSITKFVSQYGKNPATINRYLTNGSYSEVSDVAKL
ncbi:DUF3718 domain-containing protein [Paraglaciecola aquimarina]|uniref:DUF3718 domain-containing protein n=1 Tax=Paraglaciecola aquimarina TaxID=1235557 RepID=A0ABU3SXF5_9ALTE|nr:DUF3718 domain-containing protein [Paraglaciecola aquimarina]MDU0354686.1 DUF3718 domain-containing protein [Paraglaciecola aquimarina]